MTYLAFVLDQPSVQKLLEFYPPKFPIIHGHHVTIFFPKNKIEYQIIKNLFEQYKRVTSIEVLHERVNSASQCVAVKFNGDLIQSGDLIRSDDSFYHITISHEKFTKPSFSNFLKEEDKTVSHVLQLSGTVQFLN